MTSGLSATSFTVAATIPGVVSWESMKKVNIRLTALSMSRTASSFPISSNRISKKFPTPCFDSIFFCINPFSSFAALFLAYQESYVCVNIYIYIWKYVFTETRWNNAMFHLHESINSCPRNVVREAKPISPESSPTNSKFFYCLRFHFTNYFLHDKVNHHLQVIKFRNH